MLERLHIRNYRVFNDLKIDQLSRINLIAGKNNSGKTSLLEAIWLLAGAGNPQIAINVNVVRGIALDTKVTEAIGETFWKPMFSELDMSKSIEIMGHHQTLGRLTLEVASEQPRTTEISLDRTGSSYSDAYSDAYGASVTKLPHEWSLVFRYTSPEVKQVGRTYVEGRELKAKQDKTTLPFEAAIVQSRTGTVEEDAILLGALRKKKQDHLLLNALQVIEPKLQSIENNFASGAPMMWGDIGLSELIPLPVMGEGMARIARLVLAISAAPDGVVLMDEIENGLHHSVLPKVWKVVDTAAQQFSTQIFATTHSFECVEATQKALGADGFLLHRLEASGTENRCVTYEPEEIDVALRHNLEIR